MESAIGIDLDRPITIRNASFRFFDKGEYHVTRRCSSDVLLLVTHGVLRFTEDGKACEVKAGEYFIQKKDGYQNAEHPSDEPRYLYVHFFADWSDEGQVLQKRGSFNIARLSMIMKELDRASHAGASYTEKLALFLTILSMLYSANKKNTLADEVANFISENMRTLGGLDEICDRFCYSKNHMINLFKAEYGMTPIAYLGQTRIKQAMYLAEVTSKSFGAIAEEVGFHNYSHFYRLFMKKVGMSPEKWREILRSEECVM